MDQIGQAYSDQRSPFHKIDTLIQCFKSENTLKTINIGSD